MATGAPSLKNSKANPLIINVENQKQKCQDVIIMFMLCGKMLTLYLVPACFLCLVYKAFNRKGKILLHFCHGYIGKKLKPKAAINIGNCSYAASGDCAQSLLFPISQFSLIPQHTATGLKLYIRKYSCLCRSYSQYNRNAVNPPCTEEKCIHFLMTFDERWN